MVRMYEMIMPLFALLFWLFLVLDRQTISCDSHLAQYLNLGLSHTRLMADLCIWHDQIHMIFSSYYN